MDLSFQSLNVSPCQSLPSSCHEVRELCLDNGVQGCPASVVVDEFMVGGSAYVVALMALDDFQCLWDLVRRVTDESFDMAIL